MGPQLCVEILLRGPYILNSALLLVKIEVWEGPASQVTQAGRKPVAPRVCPSKSQGLWAVPREEGHQP